MHKISLWEIKWNFEKYQRLKTFKVLSSDWEVNTILTFWLSTYCITVTVQQVQLCSPNSLYNLTHLKMTTWQLVCGSAPGPCCQTLKATSWKLYFRRNNLNCLKDNGHLCHPGRVILPSPICEEGIIFFIQFVEVNVSFSTFRHFDNPLATPGLKFQFSKMYI